MKSFNIILTEKQQRFTKPRLQQAQVPLRKDSEKKKRLKIKEKNQMAQKRLYTVKTFI